MSTIHTLRQKEPSDWVALFLLSAGSGNVDASYGVTQRSEVSGAGAQINAFGIINVMLANGTGTIGNVTALQNQLSLVNTTQPLAKGVTVISDIRSGATLDNFYGFNIEKQQLTTGTINNFYGYRLNDDASAGATNAWAFYNDANIPSWGLGLMRQRENYI